MSAHQGSNAEANYKSLAARKDMDTISISSYMTLYFLKAKNKNVQHQY